MLDFETLSVAGQEYDCYRMRVTYMGVTMTAWIDRQGRTVKEESPAGMVLLREDQEQAMHGGWGDRVDVVETAAIEVDTPFYSENLRSLTLRLLDVDLEGFQLDGGRQTLQGNIVRIEASTIGKENSYRLPFAGEGFECLAGTVTAYSKRSQ